MSYFNQDRQGFFKPSVKDFLLSAVCFAALCASPAIAQDDASTDQPDGEGTQESQTLEEIVITARKREERLQDVPITVNAFSAEEIQDRGLDTIELLEESTPGFTMDYLGGTRARPTIRGIGSDETGPGGDPSVGVFLDGVYLGRSGMQAVDTYDMARVEVLKGPQGTLFGRNVVGGAVRYVTNKPTDTLSARVTAAYGNYATVETNGFINVPVNDELQTRVAWSTKDNEGYGINDFTGNRLDDTQRRSARFHAAYRPTAWADFLFTADVTTDDAVGRVGNQHQPDPPGDVDGPFENDAEFDGFNERTHYGFTLNSNFDVGFGTVTNITAFRDIDEGFLEDWDGFNRIEDPDQLNVDLGLTDDASTFSSETRLDGTWRRLTYTAGVYYFVLDAFGTVTLRTDATGAETVREPFDTDLLFEGDGETTSVAVFGEATYAITDRLNFTGGLRYTRDTKDFAGAFSVAGGAVEVFGFEDASVEDETFEEVTWRASIDYRVLDETLVYFTASTGFKSGAFPLISTSPEQFTTALDPETAENYEVGVKSDLFNDRLRVNLSGFMQDFENLQIISVAAGEGGEAISAPRADINGVEADVTAFLTDRLSTNVKYTYLDATYGEIVVGGTRFDEGLQVIRTPKHDFVISARYEHVVSGVGLFYAIPSLSYRSEVFDDPDNNLEERRPPRTLVNASVGWESPAGDWEVRAYGRNLTDENYFNRVSNIGGTVGQSTSGPPRHYGIELTYRFR